jgi:crossover junction endodeoxyribonuclease RuvC
MSVTPRQFEQLKARLSGARPVAQPVFESSLRPMAAGPQIIIGIDPSLRGTGFGVIKMARPHPLALTHGVITCPPGWEHSRCLLKIMQTLREIAARFHPTVCAIEGLFYAQNLQTALTLGEARGAALTAMAEAGLDIYEIAPRKVKQAIVGYGAAHKEAVAKMVQRLLHLTALPAPDAADALAIALAHAQDTSRYGLTAPKKI